MARSKDFRELSGFHNLEVNLFCDEEHDPEWIQFLRKYTHEIEA